MVCDEKGGVGKAEGEGRWALHGYQHDHEYSSNVSTILVALGSPLYELIHINGVQETHHAP